MKPTICRIASSVREQLLGASSATLDRMLIPLRVQSGRFRATRPGTMLPRRDSHPGRRLEQLKDIEAQLPFPWLGLDSDNGGEFINRQVLHWC